MPGLNNIPKNYLTWLQEAPDAVDEVDSTTSYLGWIQMQGTDLEDTIAHCKSYARWLIVKIVITGTETYRYYANGRNSFDQIWDNRASLTYHFKSWK
jgi:hypothetical protein